MSIPDACCTLPPVSSNYEPQGRLVTIGKDLEIYETKDKSPKLVLICAYDIFGFHPNTKQFADILSSSGLFRVVMPDFFRGQPVTEEQFAAGRSEIIKFVMEKGSWDKVVKPDLISIMEHYRKEGAQAFGIFGFCFGGLVSAKAVCELDDVKGAGLIHPSMIDMTHAEGTKSPVLFIPTKDEPDMLPLYEVVKKRLGADKTEHHRFDDVHHGYAAARGDWTDAVQKKRVNETISLVHNFFKKHMSQ